MFKRISVNSNICGGKPCIKGTRIPVYMILELVEEGISFEDILRDYYPHITRQDIKACIEYAKAIVENEEIHFAKEFIPVMKAT